MKIRDSKGSLTVEFMAIMPFFIFVLAVVITAALWIFKAQMAHLKAYGKARKAVVYMANDGRFGKISVPYLPSLQDLQINLNRQGEMDNQ